MIIDIIMNNVYMFCTVGFVTPHIIYFVVRTKTINLWLWNNL